MLSRILNLTPQGTPLKRLCSYLWSVFLLDRRREIDKILKRMAQGLSKFYLMCNFLKGNRYNLNSFSDVAGSKSFFLKNQLKIKTSYCRDYVILHIPLKVAILYIYTHTHTHIHTLVITNTNNATDKNASPMLNIYRRFGAACCLCLGCTSRRLRYRLCLKKLKMRLNLEHWICVTTAVITSDVTILQQQH